MTADNVIQINRNLIAKCQCGEQLWYIHVDKPIIEDLTGIECSSCGNFYDLKVEKPKRPRGRPTGTKNPKKSIS